MTISELICRLQSVKCEHGDLLVTIGLTDDEGAYADARVGGYVIGERCFTIETESATRLREQWEGDNR